MATIRELFEANGCKPVKVRDRAWLEKDWFFVLGISPKGRAVGWDERENGLDVDADENGFELYQEPVELVPHWPVLFSDGDEIFVCYQIFPDIDAAKKVFSKATRLVTEYPPIMLERRS